MSYIDKLGNESEFEQETRKIIARKQRCFAHPLALASLAWNPSREDEDDREIEEARRALEEEEQHQEEEEKRLEQEADELEREREDAERERQEDEQERETAERERQEQEEEAERQREEEEARRREDEREYERGQVRSATYRVVDRHRYLWHHAGQRSLSQARAIRQERAFEKMVAAYYP
jgi:hypothetical protein